MFSRFPTQWLRLARDDVRSKIHDDVWGCYFTPTMSSDLVLVIPLLIYIRLALLPDMLYCSLYLLSHQLFDTLKASNSNKSQDSKWDNA
jgi:hypothetical protein